MELRAPNVMSLVQLVLIYYKDVFTVPAFTRKYTSQTMKSDLYQNVLVCYVGRLPVSCTNDVGNKRIIVNLFSNTDVVHMNYQLNMKFFVSVTAADPDNPLENSGFLYDSTVNKGVACLRIEMQLFNSQIYYVVSDFFPTFQQTDITTPASLVQGITAASLLKYSTKEVSALNVMTFQFTLHTDVDGLVFEFFTSDSLTKQSVFS